MKKNLFLRLICLICALVLCLGFVGCGEEASGAYTITVQENGYGKTDVSASANAGDRITVDVSAAKGYKAYAVYVNGKQIDGNEFVMPEQDVVVSVAYLTSSDSAHSVTVVNGEDGSTVADLLTAESGAKVTLNTYPSYNRVLAYYSVNGEKIEGNTFTMPDSDVLITTEYSLPIEDTPVSITLTAGRYDATSYWYAEYTEKGIRVKTVVEDPIIYTSYKLQSNYAYHDNIEYIIGLAGSDAFTSAHLKLLVSADGSYFLQYYNNGWATANTSGITVQTKRVTVFDYGFNGYEVTSFIPYYRLGADYSTGYGNLAICPAMRNTLAYFHTNWASYGGMKCTWGNPKTHLVIGTDGTFRAGIEQADYLVAGDSVLSSLESLTLTQLYDDTFTYTNSESTVAWWTENISEIAAFGPETVFFSCGTNDLAEKTVLSVFTDTQTFLKAFRETVGADLVIVSAIPYVSTSCDPEAVAAYNSMVKEYVEGLEWIEYIDLCSYVYKDGVLNKGLYGSSNYLSEMGNALLNKLVLEKFGSYKAPTGDTWGDVGENITIGTWMQTGNTLSISVGGGNHIYLKDFSSRDFVYEVNVTVSGVYYNDSYPKFGLSITGANGAKCYFVYADGLTKKTAGVVERTYSGYNWTDATEITVPDLLYTSGHTAKLKLVKSGNIVRFTVNDTVIFSGTEDLFGNEAVTLGFLSFNLGLQVTDLTVSTDAEKITEALQ